MHRFSEAQRSKRIVSTIGGVLLSLALLAPASSGRCADVVIDPSQTFQTILGWGHGGGILGGTGGPTAFLDPTVADAVNYQYLDYLVDEVGLTGTRTWEVGPRIDGLGMDHGDCDTIDWNLFEGDTLRPSDAAYLQYFRDRVLAQGIQPSFYSSPGYPTHASDQKPWVMNHPGERAQQIWASALYMKNTYGLDIAYGVIYNEPSMAGAILTDDVKALGPRLAAHGLATMSQFAEAVAPQTDWNYIFPAQYDPEMWPFVGRISYHNYGTADPYRANLRDFALAKGLTTAQTEMGDPTYDDLFADLTLGGVSYWEVAYSSSLTLAPSPGLTSFTPTARSTRFRQLTHYVRPGAVRIAAASGDPSVRVLAFTKNGAVTTVIENTAAAAQTVNLNGLPQGLYGLSRAANGATSHQELGIQTVGADGTLSLPSVLGNSAVTTLYPYTGPNHAPTIQIWGTNPGYVVAPATAATLSVTASDPELDPLSYTWSVFSQPAGAAAQLATPSAATTNVTALTVPGTYVFNIDVQDGTNTSSKKVTLLVFDSNPPPVLAATGFRIAAPYGLVFGLPTGTTHANIELPVSSVVLQAGISDLANSNFTGRGVWSVVSQPVGANVSLSTTTYIYVSIRSTVTGMTVPGDYLFHLDVSNPGHAPLTAQILCTVHPASSGPVINSIAPASANLTLPVSSTLLSAQTSTTTTQVLRHWWVVKNAPAGARPVFDHQGLTSTTVSNLLLPGSYTFTLRAFDDIHMTTRDVALNVHPAAGAPVIGSAAAAMVVAGTPFTYTITASNNPTSFTAGNLAPGLAFTSATISGTPTTPGRWNIPLSATNASGTGNANLMLTVALPAPAIVSSLTADGVASAPFNYAIAATHCPASYAATGLPTGLICNAGSGVISGTPTAAGVTTGTITATNATGSDTRMLTIAIYASAPPPTPAITSPLAAAGTVGVPFNYTIVATNSPTRYLAAGLPPGLRCGLSSPGATAVTDPGITGVPLVAGTYNVTIEAGNLGGMGTATLVLTIAEPVGPKPAAPASITVK